MGMGIDEEADPQAMTRCKTEIPVNLAVLRIDQSGCTGIRATDEIGLAAPSRNLLENHGVPLVVWL
jgi:hypothetical protein